MEKLEELFNQRLEKIKQLDEFLEIYAIKQANLPKIIKFNEDVEKFAEKIEEAKFQRDRMVELQKRYQNVMNKARRQEITMLNMIEKLDKSEIKIPAVAKNILTPSGVENCTPSTILRSMSIQEYQKSPFVKKIKPISLNFLDFEATISSDDFQRVPKYMKGRESIAELTDFLETVIIKCFNEKYVLLHKKRDTVRNPMGLEIWKLYHTQEDYYPGSKFITQGDVSRMLGRQLDKKFFSRVTILKHLQIIQEKRQAQTIFYIWVYKSSGNF